MSYPIKTKQEKYITCPHCDEGESPIDHLLDSPSVNFGPWYCDRCGGSFKGSVKNGEVTVKKLKQVKHKCLVQLKYGDVLLIVDWFYYDGNLDEKHIEYHFNQHTCPINYMRDVRKVVDLKNLDDDPHGIFEFVRAEKV